MQRECILTAPQLEHVFEPAEMEALHLGQELWGFESGIFDGVFFYERERESLNK